MIGQCRLCGELIQPPGVVEVGPNPRLANFALLAVGAFFHVLQRHPEVKPVIDTLMGQVSQHAAALCLSTVEADQDELQAGLKGEVFKMVEQLRFCPVSKQLTFEPSAIEPVDGNSTKARTT